MIAYNSHILFNTFVQNKVKTLFTEGLIDAQQYSTIIKAHPVTFYSPNVFVKIGLFLFTNFVIYAGLGLFSLIFLSNFHTNGNGIGIFISLLFAIACFAVLEVLIKQNKIYHSGVDEALLYSGLLYMGSFLFFVFGKNVGHDLLLLYVLFLPILAFAAIRYGDRLVALAFIFCVYAVFFLSLIRLGELAKLMMPFALGAFSAGIYVMAKTNLRKDKFIYWKQCLVLIESCALLVLYLACNYLVIRESSIGFFDMHLAGGEDIPMAYLFYGLTVLVPIIYIYLGLKLKDKTLLWVGLLVIAFSVFTFKYYFSLGHPEITLTSAGIILIAIAYFSIKYLKTPKHGLTFKEELDEDSFLKTNAEALATVQAFTQSTPNQSDDLKFGDGQSGGAGSGGAF